MSSKKKGRTVVIDGRQVEIPPGVREIKRDGQPSSWIADRKMPGQKRRTKTVDNVFDAIKFYEKIGAEWAIAQANPGEENAAAIAKGAWTLSKAYERTNADHWADRPSVKTNLINSQAAFAFFGENTLIESINDRERVAEYADHLAKTGNSNSTINKKLSCLLMMLKTAKDYHQLQGDITRFPRKRVIRETNRREITEKEEETISKLFEHTGKHDHKDAFEVLIDTGLRLGELWRLDSAAVDFESGQLHLWRTKNYTARSVPMSERVRQIMRRRVELYPEGPLWPKGSKDWMRNGWEVVRSMMGLNDDVGFVPHSCRHTACSRLVRGGMPIPNVMRWMGHKDISVTMRYSHLAPGQLMEGLEAMKRAKEMERQRALRMVGHAGAMQLEEDEQATKLPAKNIERRKSLLQ